MIKTQRLHCRGRGFNPCWGTKIPHGQNKKQTKQNKNKQAQAEQTLRPGLSSGKETHIPALCGLEAGCAEMGGVRGCTQGTDRVCCT